MALAGNAVPIGSRLPAGEDRVAANQLRRIIAANSSTGRPLRVHVTEDEAGSAEIVLTPGLSQIMLDLLRHIGRGDAVTLFAVGQQLTTQEAADILNVSRPHLIKLLERGDIRFDYVGKHRRIEASDLLNYKRKRDESRGEALTELIGMDADLI